MEIRFLKTLEHIKKSIKFGLVILILTTILLNSIHTGYSGYLSFYEKEPVPYFDKFENIIFSRPFQFITTYTGMNTGYGFFSPNVASDFVIIHRAYRNGLEHTSFSDSMFKTKEGALRFTNINSLYMDKIEHLDNDSIKIDSLRMRYLDVILNRMSAIQMDRKPTDSINTTLFLYHFPYLKEYPNIKPKFIKIENNKRISQQAQ